MDILWDQVKPEYKELIEADAKKATSRSDKLIASLKDKHWWPELTVLEVMNIINICGIETYKVHSYMWKWGEDLLCED
jgi:hypothetical protein